MPHIGSISGFQPDRFGLAWLLLHKRRNENEFFGSGNEIMEVEIDKIELKKALNFYFSNGRPRYFRHLTNNFLDKFPNILSNCNIEEGIQITSQLFLMCYTLAEEYKLIQDIIYNKIAMPYYNWIVKDNKNIENNISNKNIDHNKYLLVVRHAVTKGMYSPGQTTYFLTKLLLERGKSVTLIVLGKVDQSYLKLEADYNGLEILKLTQDIKFSDKFDALENIFIHGGYKYIITDQEFSEISYISSKYNLKNTILLSAGYYKLPWYGKILKPNVLGMPENSREISTQMPIDLGLLNPSGSDNDADKTRQNLGFERTDIVFGCFARLEKFNDQYIKIAKAILTKIPNSRLLIAGTNSNSYLRGALQEFLETKRAVILGFSDSHALGHILTFGLETTPTLSGSTVLELYAKSVPVITCSENVTDLGYIAEARVPELVYDSVDGIIADISRFTDASWRLAMGNKCVNFVSEMSERCKSSYFEILDK